jgi:serine/threonine protein kinase
MATSVIEGRRVLEGSRWNVIEVLGEGGGGTVFLCVDTGLVKDLGEVGLQIMDATAGRMTAQHGGFGDPGFKDERCTAPSFLGHLLRAVRAGSGLAAVKVPSPGSMQPTESERFGREIRAMKLQRHPALIRLFDHDSNSTPKWFAMEYHPGGDLEREQNREQYLGKPLAVLRAIRPIAEGLRLLHEQRMVHRDVKPKNIFVADDGRLVLGDFGIVFMDGEARLTGATIQSKDWVPDWVRFGDLASYTSVVDVFMLARVAYFLISGEKVMSSQFDDAVDRLRQRFPDERGLGATLSLLRRCIVNKERDCAIPNGGAFADEIDQLLLDDATPTQARLLFSFFSENGIRLVARQPRTGMRPLVGLDHTKVLVNPTAREFHARARCSIQSMSIAFALGGNTSASVTLNGGSWSEPVVLQTPRLQGWQDFSVMADGLASLTGFLLYAQ